jgi:hypothetical protein
MIRSVDKKYIKFTSVKAGLFILAASFAAAGCGKSVEVDSPSAPTGVINSTPPGTTRSLNCDPQDRVHWTFQQPEPENTKSIDLLFVADTSSSMNAKRASVANAVSSFVSALSSGTDYRIGVMLAHGAKSSYSGKLYAASGSRVVLDSSLQSAAEIQSELKNSLVNVVSDPDDANGEAMMASFQNSLSGTRYSKIRSQGFYRNNAALAVIFISDENDICYPPQNHGFTSFPDYVAAPTNIEQKAYASNCVNASGQGTVTPASTLAALKSVKPEGDYSVAGIVHVDPAKVPSGSGIEESIGHGILELIDQARLSAPGRELALDITSTDFAAGLSSFGALTSSHLSLLTVFQLTNAIDPQSIIVSVDQSQVPYTFDASSAKAQINASDAGGAGSIVNIDACRAY